MKVPLMNANDVLRAVYHQLSTDSDLETVTGNKKYAHLIAQVGLCLGRVDPHASDYLDENKKLRLEAVLDALNTGGYWRDILGWSPELGVLSAPKVALDSAATFVFDEVCRALQDAEGIAGPEGVEYLNLMERISQEAHQRASVYKSQILTEGHPKACAEVRDAFGSILTADDYAHNGARDQTQESPSP